jgi:hypothetical protein
MRKLNPVFPDTGMIDRISFGDGFAFSQQIDSL